MKLKSKSAPQIFHLLFILLLSSTYALSQGTWAPRADMLFDRKEINDASTVHNGKIYVLGGTRSDGTISNSFHSYDPQTNTWDSLAPYPLSVWRASLQAVGAKIYGFGGYENLSAFPFDPTSQGFVYEPLLDLWTPIASMIIQRGSAASVVLDGKIHVMGGTNTAALTAHNIYNPVTNSWENRASMSQARSGLTAAAINGKIYAVGGYFLNPNVVSLSSMEVYDTATNSWSNGASMPLDKLGITSAAVGGRMFVFGNEGNQNVLEYDPSGNSWSQLGPMPENVNFAGSAAIGNDIYVFGGGPVNLATDGIAKNHEFRPVISELQSKQLAQTPQFYPNPSKGWVHLKNIDNEQLIELEVFSEKGKLVYRNKKIPENKIDLDLPPGIYYVRLVRSETSTVDKLIIE